MKQRVSGLMKRTWNELSRLNAMHFIATERESWDTESFLESGRQHVKRFLTLAGLWPHPKSGVALDLGCGIGRLSFALSEYFDHVIGVDVSEIMVDEASALRRKVFADNVEFHCTDGISLHGFNSNSFDLALSYVVFQHMPSRDLVFGAIREMARITKPGGMVLFQVPVYHKTPLVLFWRVAQRAFRAVLSLAERMGAVSPEKGLAFRGTRLSSSQLELVIHESGLTIVAAQREQSQYTLCDDVFVCARKR